MNAEDEKRFKQDVMDELRRQAEEEAPKEGSYNDGYDQAIKDVIKSKQQQEVEHVDVKYKKPAEEHTKIWNAGFSAGYDKGTEDALVEELEASTKSIVPVTAYMKGGSIGGNMTHNKVPTTYVIITVGGLPKVRDIFESPALLVGWWMEAVHTNDVEGFFDDLHDVESVSIVTSGNHLQQRSYDQTCAVAAEAIEIVWREILLSYNISQVKQAFYKNKVKHAIQIDSTSVLLVMVPR